MLLNNFRLGRCRTSSAVAWRAVLTNWGQRLITAEVETLGRWRTRFALIEEMSVERLTPEEIEDLRQIIHDEEHDRPPILQGDKAPRRHVRLVG